MSSLSLCSASLVTVCRRAASSPSTREVRARNQSAASGRGVCCLCRPCLRRRPSVQQAAVPRTALSPVRSALLSRSACASSTRFTRSQVRASLHWRHLAPLTVALFDSSLGFRCRRAPPLLEPLRQWRPPPSRPSRPPCRPARSLRRAPAFAARAPSCAADSPHHQAAVNTSVLKASYSWQKVAMLSFLAVRSRGSLRSSALV